MSAKLIQCSACGSENLDNSVYCCQCGSPMRRGIPARLRKTQWGMILGLALVLSLVMTTALRFLPGRPSAEPVLSSEIRVLSAPETVDPVGTDSQVRPDSPEQAEAVIMDREQLVPGRVSIANSKAGRIISEFPAVVVNGSWLALASRACVGGDRWFFQAGRAKPVLIEGGIWGPGDRVGLWRLGGEQNIPGAELGAWRRDEPVWFLSLETGRFSGPMTLVSAEMQGSFLYCVLPGFAEEGVFFQNGRVVGWSFAGLPGGAYMWPLEHDANLLYENYVDDFYNETFAGGREELLLLALAPKRGTDAQEQLRMFAEAFAAPARLSPSDTPRSLRTGAVTPVVRRLVRALVEQEQYQDIAALAEEPLLWEIGSEDLLVQVLTALVKTAGPGAAVLFLEGPGADILSGAEKPRVKGLRLELYVQWIKFLLDRNDTAAGREVYGRALLSFNRSPKLHLIGVELALAEGDWAAAEQLLNQWEYPHALRETRALLAARVSELKGRENRIVITFPAGSREIPVSATVNGSLAQEFLIDTGASFVTVPTATIRALGLEGELSPHLTEVRTAGGVVLARSVALASIELQGWSVPDVTAFVMDLPDRSGERRSLGLLGLNFLNNFRVDLQTDKGVLTLAPR